MLLMLDNHDSFTWNLVHYFQELGAEVVVRTNDDPDVLTQLDRLLAGEPGALCLSPGPGRPEDAGLMPRVIERVIANEDRDLPMLGVCLGHQAIAQALGARVVNAGAVMHGKVSALSHDGKGLFAGLPAILNVCRYHSLAVEEASLPACLQVTAHSDDGEVMALAHRTRAIAGVQFHPEAILSEHGHALLRNFLMVV